MALSWGHINVNVRDLDRSIAFYKLLGFSVHRPDIPYLGLESRQQRGMPATAAAALEVPAATVGRACIMSPAGGGFPKIDLTEWAKDAPSRSPAANADAVGIVRLCFLTADLAALHGTLSAQGVHFVTPPQPMKDGMARMCVCRDPDGNLVEVLEVVRSRWPARSRV